MFGSWRWFWWSAGGLAEPLVPGTCGRRVRVPVRRRTVLVSAPLRVVRVPYRERTVRVPC